MKKTALFFLLVVLFSCVKENIVDNTKIDQPVFAGAANDNMFHEDITPDFSLDYTWNGCGHAEGRGTIDLLGDGRYVMNLRVGFLDYGAFLDCCPVNMDCIPTGNHYSVYSPDTVEMATYKHPHYDYYFTFADTINAGYRIDTIENWHWSVSLWSIDYPVTGSWWYISSDKYLALRVRDSNDYKYGWMRVGTNYDHNLVFKEFSLEK